MTMTKIESILDLARWAPSGDNEQPWQFEILSESQFVIHGHDTSSWCVYDLDGFASQIALGALIESIKIAASKQGLLASFSKTVKEKENYQINVLLEESPCETSELAFSLEQRCTNRKAFSTKPLKDKDRKLLQEAIGEGFTVNWIEDAGSRWQMARLLYRNAYIRLTIPEAYQVHRQNIEWDTSFSATKLPDKAIGVDNLTLKIMKWTLSSWERVQFMNRYFAGTVLPRLQMDLFPGFFCGAHFLISSVKPLQEVDDIISGGRAMQRFWLTAAKLGLQFQPTMTPLIFSRYCAENIAFTSCQQALTIAGSLKSEIDSIYHERAFANHAVFMGRVGYGAPPKSRSVRKELISLTRQN